MYCLDLDCIHTTFKVCTIFTFCSQCCNKCWEIGDLFNLFVHLYTVYCCRLVIKFAVCKREDVCYVCVFLCVLCYTEWVTVANNILHEYVVYLIKCRKSWVEIYYRVGREVSCLCDSCSCQCDVMKLIFTPYHIWKFINLFFPISIL